MPYLWFSKSSLSAPDFEAIHARQDAKKLSIADRFVNKADRKKKLLHTVHSVDRLTFFLKHVNGLYVYVQNFISCSGEIHCQATHCLLNACYNYCLRTAFSHRFAVYPRKTDENPTGYDENPADPHENSNGAENTRD